MSEHHVAVERRIAAPVDAVWAVVHDTSRYAEWVDGVLEVRRHHGPATVGETYEERNRTVGPLTTISTWTVRDVVPSSLRVDTGEGFAPLKDLTNIFRLTPDGDGTLMAYEVRFRLALGPLGRVVAAVLGRSLAGEFERSLEALETLAQAER